LRPRPPSLFPLVAHELGSELTLRRVLVMSPAPKTDTLHGRLAPECHRVQVIEFEQPACRAALTGGADKRALTSVSLPHRALDRGGDVPSPRTGAPVARARLGGGGELAALELADGDVKRPVQYPR